MRLTGPHPRLIHDSQHAPILVSQGCQVTQPRRTPSQLAVVVLGTTLSTKGSGPARSLLSKPKTNCRCASRQDSPHGTSPEISSNGNLKASESGSTAPPAYGTELVLYATLRSMRSLLTITFLYKIYFVTLYQLRDRYLKGSPAPTGHSIVLNLYIRIPIASTRTSQAMSVSIPTSLQWTSKVSRYLFLRNGS